MNKQVYSERDVQTLGAIESSADARPARSGIPEAIDALSSELLKARELKNQLEQKLIMVTREDKQVSPGSTSENSPEPKTYSQIIFKMAAGVRQQSEETINLIENLEV